MTDKEAPGNAVKDVREEGFELVRLVTELTRAAEQHLYGRRILRSLNSALGDLTGHVNGTEMDFDDRKIMTAAPDYRPVHALAVAKVMAIVASPDGSGARKAFTALSEEIGTLP